MVSPTQEDLDPQGNIPNITKARIQFQRLFLSPPMGLPQVMQAVVIPVHGDASVLRYTKVPTPQPGPGEVLVKVGAVGLNHLDIFVRRGMPGKAVHLPHISGADVAGLVVAAGPGTSDAPPMGQRVLVDPAVPGGAIGEDLPGGMADYVKVPAANLIPLPDHVSFEEAACLPIAYGTAWRMLITRACLRPGETVFILGASGGGGAAGGEIGELAGAPVIARTRGPSKAQRPRGVGAGGVVGTGGGAFDPKGCGLTRKR